MVLGITGAIGSGKSTAADIITKKYEYQLISTDKLAKEIMNSDAVCRRKLAKRFGPTIYTREGIINKEIYRDLIFGSEENMKASNAIIHPIVWSKAADIAASEPGGRYLIETALPDESFRNICDSILLITADESARIERLMKNRGYSREYAETVIRNQKSEKDFEMYADIIIDNSKGPEELEENIEKAVESS